LAKRLLIIFFTIFSFSISSQAATPKETLDYLYKNNIKLVTEIERVSDSFVRGELILLALNIYQEARDSTEKDMMGVGFVTLNRLSLSKSNDGPKNISEVVFEHAIGANGVKLKTAQFSWTTKTREQIFPKEYESWIESQKIATSLYYNQNKLVDHTNGATHFVAPRLLTSNPEWVRRGLNKIRIGEHVYMRLANYSK